MPFTTSYQLSAERTMCRRVPSPHRSDFISDVRKENQADGSIKSKRPKKATFHATQRGGSDHPLSRSARSPRFVNMQTIRCDGQGHCYNDLPQNSSRFCTDS
jgi:hypothetical protein